MNLTITGYSTALFSTWYFIEELGILFDAGDGLTASLLHKARKIEHVFISHADRDHITGLLQFNQLNAREGFPKIFYPSHSGSFPAMEDFFKKFDPHVTGTIWKPVTQNETVQLKDDLFVRSIRNNHIETDAATTKSLGYQVYQTRSKLKTEFLALPQEELKSLIYKNGRESVTEKTRTNLITYSGDTPVDDYEKWNHTQILIHEATFLEQDEAHQLNTHKNKHSYLKEVMKMVSELTIETLILGHFSSRYSNEEIDKSIKVLCKEFHIKIPVYRILPGQLHRDILKEDPIN